MTDRKELIEQCPTCGAHVTQNVHGEIWHKAAEDEQCAVVVEMDDIINDLGWKMNEFLTKNGAKFDGRVFNHMKGFLRDTIQEWIDRTGNIRTAAEVAAEAKAKAEAIEAAVVVADEWWERCIDKHDGDGAFSSQEIIERIRSTHTNATRAALERMKGSE